MLQKGRNKVEWTRWRHILYGFNTSPYNSDLTPLAQCAKFATDHYASTVLKSYSYKISYHKFLLFHYEIKFPCQYIQCPYVLFRKIWKPFLWKYVKNIKNCWSPLLKKTTTHLGQLRKSTGEFDRSTQGMPKLTIKKLRPTRFARPAQFITIGLYSLMVSLI